MDLHVSHNGMLPVGRVCRTVFQQRTRGGVRAHHDHRLPKGRKVGNVPCRRH